MLDIIIIGGGIGGLSTAIALQKKGLNLRIFESGPELRTAGAGIWVPPNAMTVLDRLGLAQEIETAGVPLQNLQIRNQKGTLLQEIDFRVSRKRFGFEPVAIHRSRLHAILSKHAMPSIFGKTCRELCEREITSLSNLRTDRKSAQNW